VARVEAAQALRHLLVVRDAREGAAALGDAHDVESARGGGRVDGRQWRAR
jgi:hypothetical protein